MQKGTPQGLLPTSSRKNTIETAMAHRNNPVVEPDPLRSDCLHLRSESSTELASALHDSARLQSSLDVRNEEYDCLLCELQSSAQIREQQQDDLNTAHRKLMQQRKQHLELIAKVDQAAASSGRDLLQQQQQDQQDQHDFQNLQQQQELDRLRKQVLLLEEAEAERQGMEDAHIAAQEELSFLRMNAAMQRVSCEGS